MVSLGRPGTLQMPLRPESDEFELAQQGPSEFTQLPFVHAGLSWGNGGANEYPDHLEDGMILSRMNPARYDADQKAALRIKDDQYYDFAADGTSGPCYLVFTNKVGYAVSGLENRLHKYNKATDPWTPLWSGTPGVDYKPQYDPKYDPGAMGSYSVTGLIGVGEAWIGASLTAEADLAGYSQGDYLTVSKGRFKKAVSTNKVYGQVEWKFTKNSNIKLRIRYNFTTPFTM